MPSKNPGHKRVGLRCICGGWVFRVNFATGRPPRERTVRERYAAHLRAIKGAGTVATAVTRGAGSDGPVAWLGPSAAGDDVPSADELSTRLHQGANHG